MKQLKIIKHNKLNLKLKKNLYINELQSKNFSDMSIKLNIKINSHFFANNFEFYRLDNLNNLDFITLKVSYLSDNLNDTHIESKFSQFESYLSNLELFNNTLNFKKFEYKYKYTLLTKFIPFLIKNGKKLKTINNLLIAASNLYRGLNSNEQFKDYAFINEFKYYILTSKDTNNFNYLLNWITTIYKPVFDIKAFNVPKISKKKTDKTLIFKIVYLPEKNRLKVAFKHISLDIKKNNLNNLNDRVSESLLDILLNYKKSYLYTRKMYIYEQVMEL